MAKYCVTMVDKIYYEIYVEANSLDEASDIAQESIDKANIISESFAEVIDIEEAS